MTPWKPLFPALGLLMFFYLPAVGALGLTGEYGYLTAFHCQSDSEARNRIRAMARDFGVREFQFYDWFADYSTPTQGTRWTDPFFRKREICKATLAAYIDEIHRQHGRAWAYVQAVGAEETLWANPARHIYPLMHNGVWHRHAGRFPCYFLNGAWARHQVAVWAPSIRQMGFDGVHWDTLGALAPDYPAETGGVRDFLVTALGELKRYKLKQTLNFVDMAWWDTSLILATVEFPYVEVWSEAKEQQYFKAMFHPLLLRRGGVIGFYPSTAPPPGQTPSQILVARHRAAAGHGIAYIAVADGDRRVVNEYWPNTERINAEERRELAMRVGR